MMNDLYRFHVSSSKLVNCLALTQTLLNRVFSKEPANYNFEYHVQDAQSGNDFGHQESRQGDVAQGKYYVLLPDGRRQTVEYIADNEGYKPKISYEQVSNGIGGGYNNGGYPSGGGGGQGGYPSGGGNGGYQY